jgi:hypothetical protein
LNTTIQWLAGRTVAPGRDKFWPTFLVRQAAHLGVFAGAILGGASFNDPAQASAILVGEAFLTSGLATLTAERTLRPAPLAPVPAATAAVPPSRMPLEIVVPILELEF